MSEIISRKDAKAQGLKRYFDGSECKNGHVGDRWTINGSCYECTKLLVASRNHKNPELTRSRSASYRAKNPEYYRKKNANWKKENRDSVRSMVRGRRALRRDAEGSHTAADILRIHAEQSGKCACCGKDLNGTYHVDHIMPLAIGGSNWPDNLQALCAFCNQSKGAKHPYDFSLHYAQRHGVWPLFAIARGWDVQQIAA